RLGLPRWPARRGDPTGGPDRLGLRRLRRPHQHPALPALPLAAGGCRDPGAGPRPAVGPGPRRRLRRRAALQRPNRGRVSPIVFWLQQAVLVAFVLLGVAVGADWLRRRDRERGWLVLAIVLLAAMAGLSGLQPLLGGRLLSGAAVVAFIGSGYALFRFRAAFLPVPPRVARAVLAAAAAAAGLLLVLVLFSGRGPVAWPLVAAALGAFLVWALLVAEPSLRFWLAARDRPAVQRARLRALSAGFAGLLLLVVVSAAAGRAARTSLLEAVLQLLALAIVPLLYVSFAPPAWLRRQWRAREEEAFRAATQALLTAGSRKEVAELALDWAVRLVGAESGSIQDARRNLLAERGPATSGHVLEIPLAISDGQGRLTLVSGAFTPVFGQDERLRVEQYAITVAPALDRVTLVEQLRQANAELEEASRHKSKFLAGMSHELRTPLNAILGFSELLIDGGDTLTSSVRQNFLANIHTSGKHLLGLINDILDLAKVEAGQTELYLESVAVEGVARGVLDLLTLLADRKQIGLHLTEEPVSVVADHQKVKQMLINLVSNAIKFTPAG